MHWLSIDPAKRSGVAYWRGSTLLRTAVVRPTNMNRPDRAPGPWRVDDDKHASEVDAWRAALRAGVSAWSNSFVVLERGRGASRSSDASLGERRGYIRALAECMAARVEEVELSTWRRVVAEAYGCSWPVEGERCKALAVSLVREHFGREVSADEADAVLVGVAALRMRVVTP